MQSILNINGHAFMCHWRAEVYLAVSMEDPPLTIVQVSDFSLSISYSARLVTKLRIGRNKET